MSGNLAKVFCVVAHPDDAEIALGGAISIWTSAGIQVSVAICSTSEQTPEHTLLRRSAAERAAAVLGHEVLWVVPGDRRQVEDIPEHHLVRLLDEAVRDADADVVVTHNGADSHADHRRVASAVLASSRTWPDVAMLSLAVGEHRTAAYTRFLPTIFVPVAGGLARKREALRAYDYKGKGYRTIDVSGGELRCRALGSLCDVDAAEPLDIVRVVAGTRGGRGLAQLLSVPEDV